MHFLRRKVTEKRFFLYFCSIIKTVSIMLRRFKVENFKCFKDEFVFDLSSAKAYTFNSECVKNGIVNNAMIYGYNGSGKSNLGWAILDIIEHLTDKARWEFPYKHYTNAENDSNMASFEYEFMIDGKLVSYAYSKTDYKTMVNERFCIDGKELISMDRANGNTKFICSLKGTETLNKEIKDGQLSVLKFVKNNSTLADNDINRVFRDFFTFVEHMLFFRSLEDRTYIGLETRKGTLEKDIIERGKVSDFEAFLNEANVKCKLDVVDVMGEKTLAFDFGKKKIFFSEIMSTGTSALMLFYCWYMQILESEVSFVFIDEFDAFYHHELSRMVINKLKEAGVQFVVTTHNTSIMSNDLMRPDCYFLMNSSRILPLPKCTEKELREAHNIEKIYKAGAFYVEQ